VKFSLFYFPQLGGGDPTSYDRKMIGKDPAQFRHLFEDVRWQAQMADEAGFHGCYFAEHHFDVEGFEASPNPLLFDLFVGLHTQRLRVGQLGLQLPAWNPIRLAEDIATLTYFLGDRLELGFVRGFQSREIAPLAAAHQVEGAMSDRSQADQRNRRLFQENYEILMKALTEDFISHDGEFHQIPPKGLKWMNPATQKYGGGVAPDGSVTHLGVVPKPKGRVLPQRWQAFSFSEETLRWAGRQGMNLALGEVKPPRMKEIQDLFQEESEKGGRTLAWGEGVGYLRHMLCLPDGAEARRLDAAGSEYLWGQWFAGTGFTELFRLPEDDPTKMLSYSYELLHDRGWSFAGDPDHVTRCIEKLLQASNCEHVFLQSMTGVIPSDALKRSMELFVEKVMPRFDVEGPED